MAQVRRTLSAIDVARIANRNRAAGFDPSPFTVTDTAITGGTDQVLARIVGKSKLARLKQRGIRA